MSDRKNVSVQWVSKIGGRPSLACLGASPTSRAARYARAQLVKGLRTRFRRVAATRARMPWLRFIVRNWILADPLNAYEKTPRCRDETIRKGPRLASRAFFVLVRFANSALPLLSLRDVFPRRGTKYGCFSGGASGSRV